MRTSIRTKMMMMIFGVILAFVLLCVLLNSTLLKPYYKKMKEKALTESLVTISSMDFSDGDTYNKLIRLEDSENIRILIVDESLNTYFCSSNESNPLMHFIQKWANDYAGFSGVWGAVPPHGDGEFENRYSTSTSTSYLTMYASISKKVDGQQRSYIVFLNTPIVAIEDGTKAANNFTMIIGSMLLLLGGAATFIIGTRFTMPIIHACYAAEQVASLNFDEKLPVYSNDELGLLAGSINNLSDQLRTKIEELSVANEQLKKELQHKQAVDDMRRGFISDVSHELKTPLSIILGYCEGLQMNVNSDERDYYCSVIEDEAMRMSKLSTRLLKLAELESGEVMPELSVFDLSELVSDRLDKLGYMLDERGIVHEMRTSGETLVCADQERIEEVINNLLTNAKNHTPDNGIITASVSEEEGKIVCRITNSGSHIPEESLDKIWESFYKVDKARTRSYGGSGLGLKIVGTILDTHNSKYGAKNTEDGVEFYFTLSKPDQKQLTGHSLRQENKEDNKNDRA